MSNAQVAAGASAIVGVVVMLLVRKNPPVGGAALEPRLTKLEGAPSST
jgi:hypothetical protein